SVAPSRLRALERRAVVIDPVDTHTRGRQRAQGGVCRRVTPRDVGDPQLVLAVASGADPLEHGVDLAVAGEARLYPRAIAVVPRHCRRGGDAVETGRTVADDVHRLRWHDGTGSWHSAPRAATTAQRE